MADEHGRVADHPIDPLFLRRRSPRDFSGEAVADGDLATMFEAARWAPSSSNLQPWRFLYAKRDTSDWPLFFDVLNDGNKGWAANASALLAVLSKRTAPVRDSDAVRENRSHSFDTGAAWACLALQASLLGWVTHAIGGFDQGQAVSRLGVPDDYRIECMVAIGRADPATPAAKASGRHSQQSFVRAGPFTRSSQP